MKQNEIMIPDRVIDIFASLECGQTFRFKNSNGVYEVYSKDKFCKVRKYGRSFVLETSDPEYFKQYLNIDKNYDKILESFSHKVAFKECDLSKAARLRILKQDPYEMIISFIISANNNIPRIKGIIEKLCDRLGNVQPGGYKSFPTAEKMAQQELNFYKEIGLGYRAPYILNTAKKIYNGFDINEIYNLSTDEARKELMTLQGVGPKVADCILLFGYNKYDVFPVDTWIKKVYVDLYGKEVGVEQMRKDFILTFGNYAGVAQQYLFYNKRENN